MTAVWKARVVLLEDGTADYTIKVFGYDKFGNQGGNIVNVRVDVIPPWLHVAEIVRHPDVTFYTSQIKSPVHPASYYRSLPNGRYDTVDFYKNIRWEDVNNNGEGRQVDKFQNEGFTLSLDIRRGGTDEVGDARLYVLDVDGNILNKDDGNNKKWLLPSRTADPYDTLSRWEWDITKTQMLGWNPAYATGAHYISFEVWAWKNSDLAGWSTDGTDKPSSDADGLELVQKIDGTVWYQESDTPHIYINPVETNFVNNIITLAPNLATAMYADFFDDDLLAEIYIGIIDKDTFDSMRSGLSEQAFIDTLATSTVNRTAAISAINATLDAANQGNRLNNTPAQFLTQGRHKRIPVSTKGTGEYRLIALVLEKKTNPGAAELDGFSGSYTFTETAKWYAYPPVRVQVQDTAASLIVIENPATENVFPPLTDVNGTTFYMEGYTLDQADGDMTIQIAWVPYARRDTSMTTMDTIFAAARTSGAQPYIQTGTAAQGAGIKVWNVATGTQVEEPLSGKMYYKTPFSHPFHILNDFQYSATGAGTFALENDQKLFYIRAINVSDNISTKIYRLDGTTQGPSLTVTRPSGRALSYHDNNENLQLSMSVNRGDNGVGILEGSQVIEDTLINLVSINTDPLKGPTGTITTDSLFSGGVYPQSEQWHRVISSDNIKLHYNEGTSRTYRYRATNILGITTEQERTIILSNRPLLQRIICSTGAGTYGIGQTLRFEAQFSLSVRVPESVPTAQRPQLRIYFALPSQDNPAAPVTTPASRTGLIANYVETAGNSVVFECTLTEGVSADLLYTAYNSITNASNIISLSTNDPANAVLDNHANSLQSTSPVRIDTARPTIDRAAFAQDDNRRYDGSTYYKNGDEITLKLYMSEQVRVSGTPRARVAVGTTLYIDMDFTSITQETGKYVLNFKETANIASSIAATQLSWGLNNYYISFPVDAGIASNITDVVGNAIAMTMTNANQPSTVPSDANRRGDAWTSGGNTYIQQGAYLKTSIPATPNFTLHRTTAEAGTGANAMTGDDVLYNGPVYIRVTGGETNTTLYYSITGGTTRLTYSGTYQTLPASGDNKYDESYKMVTHSVTTWQIDRAGNESAKRLNVQNETGRNRTVTINERPPKLTGIDFEGPDASYKGGTNIPIKLNFSNGVKANAGGTVTLTAFSTDPADYTGDSSKDVTITGNYAAATDLAGMLTINWLASPSETMKNIKIRSIVFNANMADEYGNQLANYDRSYASESASGRPLTTMQLNRPYVEVRPKGPAFVSALPTRPVSTAPSAYYNGNILTGVTFTLNFDAPLTAVPGYSITIRPYGTWAIPPVLTVEEFDSVYNADFRDASGNAVSEAVKTRYQKRLRTVDSNGLPDFTGITYGTGESSANYNLYKRLTHGLSAGRYDNVRPDTTTKMVLDYNVGLYDETNANNLRTIFNAARWKQQQISVTSSYVSISGAAATVTIPQALDKGRIWEIIVPEGAFQDSAGNPSGAISAGTYRFWSSGTESPVVRVNRISYDNRNSEAFNASNTANGFINATGQPLRPIVDTKVRIDCETPGASIRYNVIRTSYTPAVANGTNTPFSNTTNTRAGFFGANLRIPTGITTGYAANTIGNDGITDAQRDAEGYFNTLLTPNAVDTEQISGTSGLTAAMLYGDLTTTSGDGNGTFDISRITGLYTAFTVSGSAITGGGRAYRTYDTTNGNVLNTPGTNNNFIYIGDSYSTDGAAFTNDQASGETDAKLFRGRRDYIIAVAKKDEISRPVTDTAGLQYSGPALDISPVPSAANKYAGTEGVYKTTVLYRAPRRQTGTNPATYEYVTRLLMQGFDEPVIPVVAGFPLRDADSITAADDNYSNYFSKQSYRRGTHATTPSYTDVPGDGYRDYIWVSWEIVTDWYQKGKAFRANGTGNYLNNNNGTNFNSVKGTYGGVIYRYQQTFYQ